jgi:phosphoesterase RecJ-like protein
MSLDLAKQLDTILKRSHEIVIFTTEQASGDAIGSAWALAFFLEKLGKSVTVALTLSENQIEKFSFLEKPSNVVPTLSGARDFVLSFNTEFNKIIDVKTERDENELRIFITPEKGSIDPRDFSFIPARFKYDLAITLDCSDKEKVGKIYEENPDIFYEVPVVNIDHKSENENFGQINIVDVTAGSTSEVLADILEKIDPNFIDEKIAQCLLTGIIDATNSFQKKNTTPRALHMAAALMTKGADQQTIIRYLYKTQPLHLLKLWGKIMAKLNWEDELKLVWAPVFLEDFVQSRSSAKDVPFILDKIKENYSLGKIFMIVYNETPEKMKGILRCSDSAQLIKISAIVGGSIKDDVCEFVDYAEDLSSAGKKTIEKIKFLLAQ